MNNLSETRVLLQKNSNKDEECSSSEEWTDGSSCSYSTSESSIAEWENSVDDNGELFYIDCHPRLQIKEDTNKNKNEENFTRTSTRRSTRAGKLARLMKKKESKRQSKRSFYSYTDAYSESSSATKVTFQDCQEGEARQAVLQINPQNKHKLGRRATLIESLLGLTISTFSDGNRIMISGFIPDGEAIKNRNIKIGDWLKCVNDTEVSFQTVNGFLETFDESQEVKLTLQKVGVTENEIKNQSEIVQQLINPNINEEDILRDILCDFPVGVVYLSTEDLNETGPEFQEVIYCFPTPKNRNNLCTSRGIFITLNHLLPDILKSKPVITTVLINNLLTHVVYTSFDSKLLLISLPDMRCSAKEAIQINNEIVQTLEFCYQSIDRCFTFDKLKIQVDRFFSRVFARLLTSGTWRTASQQINIKELNSEKIEKSPIQFENILPAAHWIPLPKDAQMQLDDALNELEACDYRDWNEEPLECQRLFTIIGSCVYHDGFLLVSHFSLGDLIDIHCFCREQGILHLSSSEPIRTLVLWREVYPTSCNRGFKNDASGYKTPEGRWFLLIVGNGKDLLIALMETGGCTIPAEENQGPDVFYVEEAQETLRHIQNMGISSLAEKWIHSNVNQITIPDPTDTKAHKKLDFFGNFIKNNSSPAKPPSPANKKQEVTSILKHSRNSLQKSSISINLSSSGLVFSNEDVSEDSVSQEAQSELSDEPVIGRRAVRERISLDSDDSDSDWDAYRPQSQVSGNYDSDFKYLSDLTTPRLTAGEENVLFNYIYFDSTEGILLSPPLTKTQNHLMQQILLNFRKASQAIHGILQNTIRFKNTLTEDLAKSVVNKSLIAIKEYGVLFECSVDDNKKNNTIFFWVIGRLFYTPHPRELYVCYQDTVPQNLIEIAFRLGIHMNG